MYRRPVIVGGGLESIPDGLMNSDWISTCSLVVDGMIPCVTESMSGVSRAVQRCVRRAGRPCAVSNNARFPPFSVLIDL